MHMNDIKVYSIRETANILGVSVRTVYSYVKRGKLRATKIGHRWIVSEDNLKAAVNGEENIQTR